MFFRLKCHFCGTRSKSSRGTTEFQCQKCEAWNFFNRKGEVVDAPARIAATTHSQPVQLRPSQAFAQPGVSSSNFAQQDQSQMFCQTCLTNQRIYTESLANYLPDDDHPQYYEYERKLPKYKADLESRYPQICKKCAPKVQTAISKADRFGLQQNVSKNMKDTMARGGRPNTRHRDDWSKWSMRVLLHVLGWVLYASLLVQVVWHAYSLLSTVFSKPEMDPIEVDSLDMDDLAFDPTVPDCAKAALRLRFYQPCLGALSSLVPKAILASLFLIWYNPGLALWYHHTIRVEFVFGRSQYFLMQLILLSVRTTSWLNLSNASVTSDLTRPQLLAAHGFMIAFIPVIQKYSERVIRYDAWKIKGKMMRSPDEVDVFGAFAGPERDHSPPQASSRPPLRLFERNNEPFPIESLAPRATRSNANRSLPYQPPPSPPDSQSVSDDDIENHMNWERSGATIDRTFRPQTTLTTNSNYSYGMTQPRGWGPIREEIFGMQTQQAAEEQRRTEEAEKEKLRQKELANRSPFRGTLPPDPMQRRYHGVQPQIQKKHVPLSERPDFYEQMSNSFGSQRFGAKMPSKIGTLDRTRGAASTAKKNVSFPGAGGLNLNEDDEDFSPVKTRRQGPREASASGSLNFHQSGWQLPDKTEATGLEDLFGGRSFRIADEPGGTIAAGSRSADNWSWGTTLMWVLPVVVLTVGWNVESIRRVVCLWLVEKLEGMGY